MTDIELTSALPTYKTLDDERCASDIASNRLRLSIYEKTEIIKIVATLISRGEFQAISPPPGQHNLTYEELAEHALRSGALSDIFIARHLGLDKTQIVSVDKLAPR
jgi:hypothetical protein